MTYLKPSQVLVLAGWFEYILGKIREKFQKPQKINPWNSKCNIPLMMIFDLWKSTAPNMHIKLIYAFVWFSLQR